MQNIYGKHNTTQIITLSLKIAQVHSSYVSYTQHKYVVHMSLTHSTHIAQMSSDTTNYIVVHNNKPQKSSFQAHEPFLPDKNLKFHKIRYTFVKQAYTNFEVLLDHSETVKQKIFLRKYIIDVVLQLFGLLWVL